MTYIVPLPTRTEPAWKGRLKTGMSWEKHAEVISGREKKKKIKNKNKISGRGLIMADKKIKNKNY